jgi:hypothetical protein
MRLDAGGGQNGVRTRRCSPFPFVTYYVAHPRLSRPSRVCQSVMIPYNFLNPLNTDFNPSTTGLLYARAGKSGWGIGRGAAAGHEELTSNIE